MIFKKIILVVLFIFINLFIKNNIYATSFSLDSSNDNFSVGEEFYIDLNIKDVDESINAIKSSIGFLNGTISLLRVENGKSIIKYWIEGVDINSDNEYNFSGIIPGGYSGFLDPFNSNSKINGNILRLFFKAEKMGQANIHTSYIAVNLNDGIGTEVVYPSNNILINIVDNVNLNPRKPIVDSSPDINAYVINEPYIFNGKYVLVFNAFDKETGIKNVMVKEGYRDWEKVTSPYVLKDQKRKSYIYIRAINFSGVSVVQTLNPQPFNLWDYKYFILFLIFVIYLIFIFIKEKYRKSPLK